MQREADSARIAELEKIVPVVTAEKEQVEKAAPAPKPPAAPKPPKAPKAPKPPAAPKPPKAPATAYAGDARARRAEIQRTLKEIEAQKAKRSEGLINAQKAYKDAVENTERAYKAAQVGAVGVGWSPEHRKAPPLTPDP